MSGMELNNAIKIELGAHVTVAEMEMVHIIRVMQSVNFVRWKAAKILGVHTNTLAYKVKKYLEDPKWNCYLTKGEGNG